MARGFSRQGKGEKVRYAARLDEMERGLVAGLMEQVRDIIATAEQPVPLDPRPEANAETEFDAIVAGLGAIGQGVSLAGADQDPPLPGPGGTRDPALSRLLPTGHRHDEKAAAEFRAMTEQSLIRRKIDNLTLAMDALRRGADQGHPDRVVLRPAQATAVLLALTDVRLVLADRLGIATEAEAEAMHEILRTGHPNDPRVPAAAIYDFLSWLQESLSLALLP
ncbi:MAG: DUF2017 domain-containing protein [Nostocoides sp.]